MKSNRRMKKEIEKNETTQQDINFLTFEHACKVQVRGVQNVKQISNSRLDNYDVFWIL